MSGNHGYQGPIISGVLHGPVHVTVDLEDRIRRRIDWLKQKEAEQRRVGGPDFTSSDLLRGRTQGEIGALEWLLREANCREKK